MATDCGEQPQTLQEVKEVLNKWREENTRSPSTVRDFWANFSLDRLSTDDKWPIIEQVLIAALDLHDHALIKICMDQLDSKFPGSSRVKRLKTMAKLELRERYDEALKVYDDMIRADESSAILYKRKVAILVAQRKISEAVKELTEYLKKFMNDQEAWMELSDLYISEQEYGKAAFCLEELILLNPHNTLYHTRLGEILYTTNTPDSIELARSYFAHGVKLNPRNLRALYGLYLSCTHLFALGKQPAQKKKELAKTASWTMNQIQSIYRDGGLKDEGTTDEVTQSLETIMGSLSIGQQQKE